MTTDELLEVLLETCEVQAADCMAGQIAAAALTVAVMFHLRNEGLLANDDSGMEEVERLTRQTVAGWPKRNYRGGA